MLVRGGPDMVLEHIALVEELTVERCEGITFVLFLVEGRHGDLGVAEVG